MIRAKKCIHDLQLKSHIDEFLWRERFGETDEVFFNCWNHDPSFIRVIFDYFAYFIMILTVNIVLLFHICI